MPRRKPYPPAHFGRRPARPIINVLPPTVIISTPPSASMLEEPKPKALSRIWSVAKVTGPSAVAIAALVISLLNYNDQHATDKAQRNADLVATRAAERHNAEQVAYWFQYGSHVLVPILMVENHSEGPVNNVVFEIIAKDLGDGSENFYGFFIPSIPPCSTGTTDVMSHLNKLENNKPKEYYVASSSMTFEDRDGLYWKYSVTGTLRKVSDRFAGHLPFEYGAAPNFTVTANCS